MPVKLIKYLPHLVAALLLAAALGLIYFINHIVLILNAFASMQGMSAWLACRCSQHRHVAAPLYLKLSKLLYSLHFLFS